MADFNPFASSCRYLRSVLFYEHWMIGWIDEPLTNALNWKEAPQVNWFAPFDRSRYFADPFPWPGRPDTILCEEYDTGTHLGRISTMHVANGLMTAIEPVALPFKGHLSFPMAFTHEGETYLMPESSVDQRLEIFRLDHNRWISYAVVFDRKPVADAVIFRKDDYFWIAYTDITHDPHDNLHLVYARDLKGPWTAHHANPVQKGRDRCRGAGPIFEHNGKLYRPAQDCSRVYGGALRIMEITRCSLMEYEEKEIAYIKPTSRTYPDGFHTLAPWGDKCLVDGMRLTFAPSLLWKKIKRRLSLA